MNMHFTKSVSSSQTQQPPNTFTFTGFLNTPPEMMSQQTYYQTQSPSDQTPSPSNQTPSLCNQTHSAKKPQSNVRWKVAEQITLIGAWLNTSKDPIVGNEQKGGTFWQRVATCYAANLAVAKFPKRSANVCKQKWTKMSEIVSKFNGCHEYVSRTYHSGCNDEKYMQAAHEMYYSDHRLKFNLEHIWNILKTEQKWCSLVTDKTQSTSKRSKLGDSSSSNTVFNVEEESDERPMGVKAAKMQEKKRGKGKIEEAKGSSQTLKVIEGMWKVKKEELVAKERLSKHRIVECLIAKVEPLSEMELNLKNKLMAEIFNEEDEKEMSDVVGVHVGAEENE